MLGLGWGDCDPLELKNRRRRSSVLVEVDGLNILIDTSPDCREQLLDANISRIDAVLYTHAHADHCHGIDDLRWICHSMGAPIPIFGNADTINTIANRFDYAFDGLDEKAGSNYYKPVLIPKIIDGDFEFKNVKIQPFIQDHGHSISIGYRIGDFAYSTDVWQLDEQAFDTLKGVNTWVVDALQLKPHPTHAHLDRTLEWIDQLKPANAILTHMNIYMDYKSLCDKLPAGVQPGYDGLIIDL